MSEIWGIPSPYKSGAQNAFLTTSQPNGNFNGLYLPNETRYRQSGKRVTNGMEFLHRLKTTLTLVHKRLKTLPAFLPTLRKFCILLHCHASQAEISKRSSTKLCQLMGSQNAVQKSEPSLPQKLGAKKLLHLFGFSTTSRLNGEYLLNEAWHRQSQMGAGKHEASENCVNFSLQMA